jgi:prevent-host-death family protein
MAGTPSFDGAGYPPYYDRYDHNMGKAMARERKIQPSVDRWPLNAAKARFSELIRRVKNDGPQHVTVHGRDEVVVVSAAEFRRMKGALTGGALVEALQASPYREIEIEPERIRSPVRGVAL